MRSPIEQMVDIACGLAEPKKQYPFCTIECPSCGRSQRYLHQEGDPETATSVVCKCPECAKDNENYEIVFLDADGVELFRTIEEG